MLTGKKKMPRLLTSVTLPLRLINTAENLFVMSTCTRIFIVSSSIYVLEMHVMGHLKHIFPLVQLYCSIMKTHSYKYTVYIIINNSHRKH